MSAGEVEQQNQVAPPTNKTAYVDVNGMPTDYFYNWISQVEKNLKSLAVVVKDLYDQVNP